MNAVNVAKNTALAALALVMVSCGQAPIKPSPTHINAAEAPATTGTIPPPVQVAPVLPKPEPTVRPETYSVVVNNVRVHDLLFALARDAKINVDVHPDVSGTVTLNAIDQTLTQLLARIAKQVDMRYEIDGANLLVMRDSPFLRLYKIDYLSATRSSKMQSSASTQFGQSGGGSGGSGGGGSSGSGGSTATGGTATIDLTAENRLWESVVQNVKEILRETDKIIPAAASTAPAPVASAQPAAGGAAASQTQGAPQASATYQEAASVIANRETGVLFVRATSKQHEKVQEFVDQVLTGAKRQVLIEVSVAEVQLRNEYQRGIEWQRLRSGVTGLEFRQPAIAPPTGFNTNPFLVGYASGAYNFTATLKLLEQFGDVKVLSSPKLSVLNNQTAILRVTRDIIYFTLTPSSTPVTIASGGPGAITVPVTFTTTPNVAAEGFMMSVMPQINEVDAVVLSVRPTIRRQVGEARDPNPALRDAPTQNPIPLFETREFDSILRLQSGQVAVLAGLMQDQVENTDTGIPGIRSIPLIGPLLSQRTDLTRKTELVIFIRASVIRDPSIDGDFRSFRSLLPTDDFLRRPNPGSIAPLIGPSGEALK